MDKLYIEIADTPIKREYGLMDRKALASNRGMLFKFPQPNRLSFWMRNTYVPLDIAFINEEGRITQIEKMFPLSTRSVRSNSDCKYALEVNSDWFKNNNISVGDRICETSLNSRKLYSQVVKKKEDKKEQKKELNVEKDPPDALEEDALEEGNDVPEIEVEGNYPKSVYAVPFEEGEKPEVDHIRDLRGKIKFANDNNLEMEILYWTLRGHMLPPRKVKPMEGEGYVIKNGKSGEILVAFDSSATIQGAGWSIKGGQPKSFILDNIVKLQIIGKNGEQLTDAQISEIRNPQQSQQAQQPQQSQQPQQTPQNNEQKPKGFWDKIKNIFTR